MFKIEEKEILLLYLPRKLRINKSYRNEDTGLLIMLGRDFNRKQARGCVSSGKAESRFLNPITDFAFLF